MPSADTSVTPFRDVPLAPLTTLGVGGKAAWFLRATTVDDVSAAHAWTRAHNVRLFVMGGGSNVVVADGGFEGLVLQVATTGLSFDEAPPSAVLVTAAAGEPWDSVVAACIARGLAGIECLSGIPGTVGGTPVQNVGAYGQEVGERIVGVTVFDREAGRIAALSGDECGFAYRTSRFRAADRGRFVVCDVTFRLERGEATARYPELVAHLAAQGRQRPSLEDVRTSVLAIRRRKGMVIDAADPDTRSAGSFFVNPVVTAAAYATLSATFDRVPGFPLASGAVKVPAAWLIEQAGFQKGFVDGPVGLSTKHPLALITTPRATAADVVRLAGRIKRAVVARFGVSIVPEPVFVGFDDDPDVAHLMRSDD